jgi:hypothetical protein
MSIHKWIVQYIVIHIALLALPAHANGAFLCPMRPRLFFQYVIGSFVQLAPGTPLQRVIWRGKQVVPSITG